jgi:NAD(P)-dependent dehydrogenase (short-subunit alcohol dehydrogenase family)
MKKKIIVTGAYGNLGKAVVNAFHSAGYLVLGTAAEGEAVPGGFPVGETDIRTVDLLDEKATALLLDEWGGDGALDAAVLTVGGFALGDIANTTMADIDRQYRLNFATLYHAARPIFQQMMKRGSGRIFMIGSRPGGDMRLAKGMVAYGLAKSMVFRLAEMINTEAAGTNVVAAVVVPSVIDTPQNRASMPDADPSQWVRPEEIAEVILFHCSPAAAAVREPVIKMYGRS